VITTGDGGMLTTNNPDYDKKFRLLRHHGMNISDLARHSSKKVVFEKYVTTGYNYRMTDIQAAVGIEQLKKLPQMLAERRKIADLYRQKLKDIPWLKLPDEPAYCKTNWQSYPIKVLENAPLSRDNLMQLLLDAGISTRRGITNAHQEMPYSLNITLKASELARDSVILLPMFNGMEKKQIEKITEKIENV
jgi:dTDP-4-amino-4,6-dideoxygalactose transaminase